MSASPSRRPLMVAVFLVSAASLAFEVLLTRVFAISQWNHLAFMVISIALLGFAGAGTFLYLLRSAARERSQALASPEAAALLCLLYTATVTLAFLVLNRLPLDYVRLPVEPAQIVYLLIAYGLLALPFFFAGLLISAAYSLVPEKSGIAYFATMSGSACGAVLPAVLLPTVDEGRLVVLTALVPLLSCAALIRPRAAAARTGWSRGPAWLWTAATLVAAAAIAITIFFPQAVTVRPSVYKAQAQLLQMPQSRITDTHNSIRGLTTVVTSPYLRFAPGLSLTFGGELPPQKAVFQDGDKQLVLYADMTARRAAFAAITLPYAGYRLVLEPSNVLILQNGGGLAMACAIAAGSRRVTVIDAHPERARIMADHYRIPFIHQVPRQFLARTTEEYDVIQIETWGSSLPGSAALDQEYLLTHDALYASLDRLSAEGVIIISRRLLLPPSDLLRLWATAAEALRRIGVARPETHLAALRSWDTYVLLVSRRPLSNDGELVKFADDLNFDWLYRHELPVDWTNRHFVFDAAYHSRALAQLAEAYRQRQEPAFWDTYFLDVAPQSDDRPFPNRFLKWARLAEMYRATGSRPYTLLLSGEIVVVVIFLEAGLLSLALLALPFAALKQTGTRPRVVAMTYFLALGVGFMFVELFFIKQLVLLLGDPVVSFTVVLTGMLVFSGVGGFFSQRLTDRALIVALILLIILLAMAAPATEWMTRAALPLPGPAHVGIGLAWLALPGILTGLPFPLAMRHLMKTASARAHAWTANGCASVLASIAAAQLALSQGVAAIVLAAAATYAVALVCAVKLRQAAGGRGSGANADRQPLRPARS